MKFLRLMKNNLIVGFNINLRINNGYCNKILKMINKYMY